jgi:hypothetical protein
VAGNSDLGLAAAGERPWVMVGAGLPPALAELIQSDRMLVPLGSAAVEFLEVLAGQALIGSLAGQAGWYSGKVQQPVRICPDWCARAGTVTCTEVFRWTCCLLMACKRSGVRIPVAPHFPDPEHIVILKNDL